MAGAQDDLPRRGFIQLCASALTAVSACPAVLAAQARKNGHRPYARVRLVAPSGAPITARRLEVGRTYVFNYPFVTTPCFLIDLGRPAPAGEPLETREGARYRWPGGIGPHRSVVSFAAICTHRMSHVSKTVSFINYHHEDVDFTARGDRRARRSRVIYCCSENSVYDPTRGAKVIGGPAPQPLAAIHLDSAGDGGALSASGTYGGEVYEAFFRRFAYRLAIEHAIEDIEAPVERESVVVPLEEYSASTMICGPDTTTEERTRT